MKTNFLLILQLVLLGMGNLFCKNDANVKLDFKFIDAITLSPIKNVKVVIFGRDIVCDPCYPSYEWKSVQEVYINPKAFIDSSYSDYHGKATFNTTFEEINADLLSCAVYASGYLTPISRDVLSISFNQKDTVLNFVDTKIYPLSSASTIQVHIKEYGAGSSKVEDAAIFLYELCSIGGGMWGVDRYGFNCRVLSDTTDDKGWAVFESVPPWGKKYQIRTHKPGYWSLSTPVITTSIDSNFQVEITFLPNEKGAKVHGKVLGSQNSKADTIPLKGAKILVTRSHMWGALTVMDTVETNSDGAFEFPKYLQPGYFDVQASYADKSQKISINSTPDTSIEINFLFEDITLNAISLKKNNLPKIITTSKKISDVISISIESNAFFHGKLSIVDSKGTTVFKNERFPTNSIFTWNISGSENYNTPQGLYYISFIGNGTVSTLKIPLIQ